MQKVRALGGFEEGRVLPGGEVFALSGLIVELKRDSRQMVPSRFAKTRRGRAGGLTCRESW